MDITIVIISYNSSDLVKNYIKNLSKKIPILVIENSRDKNLKDYLEKNYKKVKVLIPKKNLGYGASIKQGVRMARGKYMFIQFSDTEYDHRVSLKMFRISEKYNADAVFGSRLKNMSLKQKLISKI